MDTPENTNPIILKNMLNSMEGGGGGGNVVVAHGTVTALPELQGEPVTLTIDKTLQELISADVATVEVVLEGPADATYVFYRNDFYPDGSDVAFVHVYLAERYIMHLEVWEDGGVENAEITAISLNA